MVFSFVTVIMLHWVVSDIFIRYQCGVYLQLFLCWLSEEALCLLKDTLLVFGIQAVIDHIEESDAMACFTDLLCNCLAIF